MEPTTKKTQNDPEKPKYILAVCTSSLLNLDG